MGRGSRHLAVAASAAYPDLRPDWPLLRAALGARGVEAVTAVWNDPAVEWGDFDLVVANGAWDNIHHVESFLAWAEQVATQTMLVNTPATLRWNIDKRYLADLAEAGVPVVPTTWVEPGESVESVLLPAVDYVVKPAVSGGGYLTARYAPTAADEEEARAHLGRLVAEGRTALVQPYQRAVDREAEAGLVFLGGRYSHAIRKGALLPPGTRARDSLHNDDVISPTEATEQQLAVAAHALGVAEARFGPTAYARVDLVPGESGPLLLELEILDPALFIEHHSSAAARFAEVLEGVMEGGG